MADYPDWVKEHKKKGTYINRVGDKYYLYAAHSERIKGTNKVRRVSDGYLGRITEKDGFIPAKRKLSGEVSSYEYGFSHTIITLCKKIYSGLRREFRENADYVICAGSILFMHGEQREEFYETSYLSLRFPGVNVTKPPTEKQRTGIERTSRMVADTLRQHFGDDYKEAFRLLPLARIVCMSGDMRSAVMPETVRDFAKKHGIDIEV